jgi:tetraacyldisaccharide-1-P 4'-kinase
VASIARLLVERGERPAILSRGYGRGRPGRRHRGADGETILADGRAQATSR